MIYRRLRVKYKK